MQADAASTLASLGALAAALMVPGLPEQVRRAFVCLPAAMLCPHCLLTQAGLAMVAWGASAGLLATSPASVGVAAGVDLHVALQVCAARALWLAVADSPSLHLFTSLVLLHSAAVRESSPPNPAAGGRASGWLVRE